MSTPPPLPFHRFDPARPPVVLLGGVNLVRTLGLAGIQAIVASRDPAEPAFASRYCTARWHLPAGRPDAALESLIDLGRQLARKLGRRVPLMYGSDDALELVYRHTDRLSRDFLFLLNDPRVAHALIAKDRFQELARERRLPVPRALAFDGDGPGTLRGTPGPVLAKPRNKVDWHQTTLCQRLFGGDGKARIFATGAEAAADEDTARHRGELTFQEYVPGGDTDLWSFHGFADEQGRVLVSFAGRKIRTFPALTGESAFIELAHDDSLERVGRDVARRCPLRGVFKMDFKRDPASGAWFLLEINARYNLWHYLAAANGLNLMEAAYRFLVDGERPRPQAYGTRYRWLAFGLDAKAYRELAGRGELTFMRWIGSLARSRNIHHVFAWRDPGPWLTLWKARITRRLRRGPARLALALQQWRSTAS